MIRVVAAFALVGCGRLRFSPLPDDAAPDVVTGHDEDGDGLPDVIDPCPHIAGDAADRDGDGVGDACDPNPDTPTEHWLRFATMQLGDQPFDDIAGFDQKADALHVASDASPRITAAFTTVRLDLGFEILGVVGTGQHQIAAGLEGTTPYYFGELNDNPPGRDVSIVSYDSTNGYVMLDPVTFPVMHAGVGFYRMDAVAGAAPAFHLLTGWVNETYSSNAVTAAYTGGTAIRFALNGLDVDLRYVALIVTD